MKTERRHELETNTLADTLATFIERAKPYSKAIVGVIVALVAVIAIIQIQAWRARSAASEGWDRYFAARSTGLEELADVAEQYRGTPAGAWARLELADLYLYQGAEGLFRDRAEANERLRRAEESFRAVLDQAEADLIRQRARFGLAKTYESLNELDKARDSYRALVDNHPDSALRAAAEQRIENLDSRSTREFYDWFASQDPRPAFETGFESTPSFDLDALPDAPDDQSSEIFQIELPDTSPTAETDVGDESSTPVTDDTASPEAEEPAQPASEAPQETDEPPSEDAAPESTPGAGESSETAEGESTEPAEEP